MDAVKIGHLTNADVYFDSNLCVGRFSEIDISETEYEAVKHATLGMVAEWNAPSRMLKAMAVKGELQWLDPDVARRMYDPTIAIPLTLDGYTDVFGPGGVRLDAGFRVSWHLTFMVGKTGMKAIKFGTDFKGTFEAWPSRFVEKNSTSPVPLREIDILNQINRVNGRDVWSRY